MSISSSKQTTSTEWCCHILKVKQSIDSFHSNTLKREIQRGNINKHQQQGKDFNTPPHKKKKKGKEIKKNNIHKHQFTNSKQRSSSSADCQHLTKISLSVHSTMLHNQIYILCRKPYLFIGSCTL